MRTIYTRAEFIDMREDGLSWREIAERAGVAPTTIRKYGRLAGVPEEFFQSLRGVGLDDEVRAMADAGLSDRQIAKRLEVSVASVGKRRRRLGILRGDPARNAPRSAEDIAKMGELLDEGMSAAAVASVIGCDVKTVARHYPGRAWSRAEAIGFATAVSVGNRKLERAMGKMA